jgi:hypothetical protein
LARSGGCTTPRLISNNHHHHHHHPGRPAYLLGSLSAQTVIRSRVAKISQQQLPNHRSGHFLDEALTREVINNKYKIEFLADLMNDSSWQNLRMKIMGLIS